MPSSWMCIPISTACVNREDEIRLKSFLLPDLPTTTYFMLRVVVIYISLLKGHFLSSLSEIFVILEQGFWASTLFGQNILTNFRPPQMLGRHGNAENLFVNLFSFGVKTFLMVWKLTCLKLDCHNFVPSNQSQMMTEHIC